MTLPITISILLKGLETVIKTLAMARIFLRPKIVKKFDFFVKSKTLIEERQKIRNSSVCTLLTEIVWPRCSKEFLMSKKIENKTKQNLPTIIYQ